MRQADLQVGDHLIVYNHQAYAATTAGVWRLENAVIVQTFPELLMQGHGSAVLNQGAMWTARRRAPPRARARAGSAGERKQ